MNPVLITQIVARAALVVQVILGIIVWTGHGDSLIPIHIAVGLLLVVDLWVAVALGHRVGVPCEGGGQADQLLPLLWGRDKRGHACHG